MPLKMMARLGTVELFLRVVARCKTGRVLVISVNSGPITLCKGCWFPMDAAKIVSKIVLCVDDDETVLMMEKLLLESAGFQVLTASSSLQAIDAFQNERVDAVVMDYFMPEMNGLAAARILKQMKPEVPIVFLSAFTESPGETLGVAEWWSKKGEEPPEVFLARLRSLVEMEDGTSGQRSSMAS